MKYLKHTQQWGDKGIIQLTADNNRGGVLVEDIGFDTVDAGSLLESWRHQPGTPAYCTELNATELKLALIDADHFKGKAAYLRDLTTEKLMARKIAPSHQEMLSVIRSLFPENPLEASFVQS